MIRFKQIISKMLQQYNRILFNSRWIAERNSEKHVLCLGDSHTRVFRYIAKHSLAKREKMPLRFDVVSVVGATAQGIANPNSKTNAFAIFRRRLSSVKSWQYVFLLLGEVDCGFVIWYRAQKYEENIQTQLTYSVDNYCNFIQQVKATVGTNVFVISAPLPTIADNQAMGEVANARKEVKATQSERSDLTIEFNRLLRERCHTLGVGFIDVTSAQRDPSNGLIHQRFINPDGLDHHLNNAEYSHLILKEIRQVLS